jgi:aryl sulfotransferase
MIFWIASYPKSGNTWLRLLIEALSHPGNACVSINAIASAQGHASNRARFDELVGVRAADLPRELVQQLRPQVYAAAARDARGPRYWKIHDAWCQVAPAVPLIPPEVTRGVLYIVRNPLDVAVSLRGHLATTQDAAIDLMANTAATLASDRRSLPGQLPQYLRTWSAHAASWLHESNLPLHLVRYEDLKLRPLPTLRAVAEFLGLPSAAPALSAALSATAFDQLRAQEISEGFVERYRRAAVFFRRGETGAWREELSDSQARRLIADHGAMMQALGYLDAGGRLLC